jgi:cytosine/adenosine deaminase-related metal-dependent hydrolase
MGAGQALAQWAPERPVVLRGKVVSMHKKVRQGQVVVRQGKVVAILPNMAPIPSGATVIETDGYIYPGLMNLHSHLSYNFLPLLDVPEHYENHDEWPNGKVYEREVNNPNKVVTEPGMFDMMDEALKYAEVRAIIGGETAIQGAESRGSINSTLVRNVELANFGEDNVGQNSLGMDKRFYDELEVKRPRLHNLQAYFLHLAEGIDDYSRREWSFPDFDPTKKYSASKVTPNKPGVVEAGMVWPGLVGIHCTAMEEEDFKLWKQLSGEGPKIVWSPTSNLLLYGETTDIAAALKHGATIALGTDWSPTGTRNLLWELKVVAELNRRADPPLFASDREIVELVTTNPAKILGWEDTVGQIRSGFVADLLVLDALPGADDGYQNLIMATEEHVQLVLVGGNPLYGDEAHMKRLKTYSGEAQYEVLPDSPPSRPKAIDMWEDTSVRSGDLSVEEVRENLLRALEMNPADVAEEFEARPKHRERARAYVIKKLEKKNKDVPASLREEGTEMSLEHVELYLELKYPNAEPKHSLDPLYTDLDELEFLATVLDRTAPDHEPIDLASYFEQTLQATQGLTSALGALGN